MIDFGSRSDCNVRHAKVLTEETKVIKKVGGYESHQSPRCPLGGGPRDRTRLGMLRRRVLSLKNDFEKS